MKKLALVSLFAAFAFTSCEASAARQVSWTLPTTRENSAPLAASELKSVVVVRDGNILQTLSTVPLPTSYIDSQGTDCVVYTYTAYVVDSVGLISKNAPAATSSIDRVACAPKPVSGFTVTTP